MDHFYLNRIIWQADSSNKTIITKSAPMNSQFKYNQKYTFAPCARLDYITEKDNVKIINVGIPTLDDKGNLQLIFTRYI